MLQHWRHLFLLIRHVNDLLEKLPLVSVFARALSGLS